MGRQNSNNQLDSRPDVSTGVIEIGGGKPAYISLIKSGKIWVTELYFLKDHQLIVSFEDPSALIALNKAREYCKKGRKDQEGQEFELIGLLLDAEGYSEVYDD